MALTQERGSVAFVAKIRDRIGLAERQRRRATGTGLFFLLLFSGGIEGYAGQQTLESKTLVTLDEAALDSLGVAALGGQLWWRRRMNNSSRSWFSTYVKHTEKTSISKSQKGEASSRQPWKHVNMG